MTPRILSEVVYNDLCTGCSSCANVCREGALTMTVTSEGFIRPVGSASECNGCGRCDLACPVLRDAASFYNDNRLSLSKCYASRSTDSENQLLSSSGGIFSEIARLVLAEGGVVFGCRWNDSFEPEHCIVTSVEGLAGLRGSKYVPSTVGYVLRQACTKAREGTKVMFSGTPCQTAALSLQLNTKARRNVILVDFICHGVPSLTLFSSYKRWLFSGDSLVNFTFRDKSLCLQTIVARSTSGYIYRQKASKDPFFCLGYGNHLSLMKSCFNCKFSGSSRVSDITLGDFWGVPNELDHPFGVSALLVNTTIGAELINKASELGKIILNETDLAQISRQNPRVSGGEWPLPRERKDFLRDVTKMHSFRWIYWRWYIPYRMRVFLLNVVRCSVIRIAKTLKIKSIWRYFRTITCHVSTRS